METNNQSYYVGESTLNDLTALKEQVNHFTSHMFSNLGKYVSSPSTLFENNLEEISIESGKKEDFLPLREVQGK